MTTPQHQFITKIDEPQLLSIAWHHLSNDKLPLELRRNVFNAGSKMALHIFGKHP
jgi:hypothetical protein